MAEVATKRNTPVKEGDMVNIAIAPSANKMRRNGPLPARVDKVYAGGTRIDVTIEPDDPFRSMILTGVARDDTGTKPDTWHLIS